MVIKDYYSRYLIFIGFLLLSFQGLSQKRSIFITDKKSGRPIEQANLRNMRTAKTVSSDHTGICHIEARLGDSLLASHIAFKDRIFRVDTNLAALHITLTAMELDLVTVYAGEPFNRRAAKGIEKIPMNFLTATPAFFGEADLFKALTLLPGVSDGREGYSHIYVRGGDQDQNLILLDGATLLNVNHIGGLISMFQPEMIAAVDFYKSHWPSKFGGRLSSVVDLRMAEGNYREHRQRIQLGLITPKFTLSGPLLKDRISYHVGGRRTLIDLYTGRQTRQLKKEDREGEAGNLRSQDFTLRIDGRIKENQHLSLSALLGRDYLNYIDKSFIYQEFEEESLEIKNEVLALNYKLRHKNSTYFTAHASYTGYRYRYQANHKLTTISNNPYLGDFLLEEYNLTGNKVQGLKLNVRGETSWLERWTANYGLENEWHNFSIDLNRWKSRQESFLSKQESRIAQNGVMTSSLFGDLRYHIGKGLNLSSGLRLSRYALSDYHTWLWEPKALLTYEIDHRSTLNAGFNLQRQHNILLGFIDDMGYFREYYVSSNRHSIPSLSKQWSIGYFRNLNQLIDNFSLEGFYKKQSDIYKFVPSSDFDKDVLDYANNLHGQGKANIYGIETLIQKTTGKLHGSLSYTYSKSTAQFPSLNGGRKFNADFDFRHNINFLLIYNFGNGYSLSGHWNYKTGRPYSLPSSLVDTDHKLPSFPQMAAMNTLRMPAFHRLDLNFERKWQTKNAKKNSFGLGVYNVYNRVNPFFARPADSPGKLEIVGLFPIIPYFTIGFEL